MCVGLEDEFYVVIGLFGLAPRFTGAPGPAGAIGGTAGAGIGVGLPAAGVEVLTCRTVPAPVIVGALGEPIRALPKGPPKDLDVVAVFRDTFPTSPWRANSDCVVLFFLGLGHVGGAGRLHRDGF